MRVARCSFVKTWISALLPVVVAVVLMSAAASSSSSSSSSSSCSSSSCCHLLPLDQMGLSVLMNYLRWPPIVDANADATDRDLCAV